MKKKYIVLIILSGLLFSLTNISLYSFTEYQINKMEKAKKIKEIKEKRYNDSIRMENNYRLIDSIMKAEIEFQN